MSELLAFLTTKLSFFFNLLNYLLTFFYNNPTCCIYLLCHLNMGDAQISKVVIISCFFFIIKLLQQLIIEENNNLFQISNKVHQKTTRVYMLALATLHQFCMTSPVNMSFDLGHWVTPRSIIWFSRFLLTK